MSYLEIWGRWAVLTPDSPGQIDDSGEEARSVCWRHWTCGEAWNFVTSEDSRNLPQLPILPVGFLSQHAWDSKI
ncbi:hypothetical protein GE21DRAFT_1279637 [Neurospora crassa]|nr:hypothetical protein GE21DRAFT_1279637 [Neurospora crassa]